MKSLKLFGLALGASLALSSAAFADDISVAVAGPMTGGESAFGRQMKNGADMAVADFNAAGGVLGKKLVLDVEDDACDPKQARSVAEKIGSSKIPFVAGHYCSSSSIPASEAYADANVLQITPASTNPLFTERKLWNVARVCGRDDQQGLVAAEYIAKPTKARTSPSSTTRRLTAKASPTRPRRRSTRPASPKRCSSLTTRATRILTPSCRA